MDDPNDPGVVGEVLRQMPPCDGRPSALLLSSAMRNNDDIDRHDHSLMLSFQDFRDLPLRRLQSTVPFSNDFRQRIMTADMAEP